MLQVAKGLAGVVVGDTALSHVDGENGRLIYHGYEIADLANGASFEEVAYLLWYGELPTRGELDSLRKRLAEHRTLSEPVLAVIRALPATAEPMNVLRTAVSALGAAAGIAGEPDVEQSILLTAAFPTIIAAYERQRRGLAFVPPRYDLGHAANFLYMLSGETPSEQRTRALDTYLILTADHGFNASTFTARVIASTRSDLCSAITGVLGALKGPLHGGAPAYVLEMLREIGTPENAEAWLNARMEQHEPVMGFGHRVYKAEDPRARVLRTLAERSSEIEFFRLSTHVEDVALRVLNERHPGARIYTNVEFWAASVLYGVELPEDLFTPAFAVSRVAGWTASVLEQMRDNRLIRPGVEYVGPDHLEFVPLDER
ncbi:MAG: citrate/2-methylcitrate synthase [Dehalococcoidia bacterium]